VQVVGISETLGLSTQEALKLDDLLRRFDERRRPLRMQVHDSARLLVQASRGDNAALGQVDQATSRILDARIQLATLDREQFQALTKDLNSQQRAKLAIFYGKLHRGAGRRFMRMMHETGPAGGGGEGEGPFRKFMRRMHGDDQMGMAGQ